MSEKERKAELIRRMGLTQRKDDPNWTNEGFSVGRGSWASISDVDIFRVAFKCYRDRIETSSIEFTETGGKYDDGNFRMVYGGPWEAPSPEEAIEKLWPHMKKCEEIIVRVEGGVGPTRVPNPRYEG